MIEIYIGFAAGVLIAVSMIPQVIKSYKTKSVKDISMWMLIIIQIGTFLWIVYGMMIESLPIIGMDGFGFIVNLTMISLKIKYEKHYNLGTIFKNKIH
jgi:MtN3 and saliva related transmembrane protein